MRAPIFIALSLAVTSIYAGEPFDVSLANSSAELSPYYRLVIRRATERYRGDSLNMVVVRSRTRQGAGVEIEEVINHFEGTTDLYVRRISAAGSRTTLAEAHFDDDPFPAELISLSYVMPAIKPSI